MLETYDSNSDAVGATTENAANDQQPGDGGFARPPRYGAFVFGDKIPLNVTVDWDKIRERPELLEVALETAADSFPADGGDFDLQVFYFAIMITALP